jgi:hypothetical protein
MESAKKKKEEVYARRETFPDDFGARSSTINVSGKRLRPRSARARRSADYT